MQAAELTAAPMHPDEAALWARVEADPKDLGRRYVLSDWLRDEQRDDEADAVKATAGKMPARISDYRTPSRVNYSFALCWVQKERPESVVRRVWIKLGGTIPEHHPSWKDYPTFLAAMIDLVRAWVAVRREEVR